MRRPLVSITLCGGHTETADILRRLERMASAQQDQIDQLTASLATIGDQLTTGVAGIRDDITALKAAVDAGQPVDLTALEASVARVADVAAAVSQLDSENPELPPVDEPPLV